MPAGQRAHHGIAADVDEFERKIGEHRHEFYRYIYRNVWDTSKADDVFSSAVLAAYDNRHKYTPGTNFRAWMYRIITNKCFVANRDTHRAFDSLEERHVEPVAPAPTPFYGEILERPEEFLDECGDEVYRAFQELSTSQRSCILLREVEQFTYKEIAEILDIPVGTVMTHLARGRKKLRSLLLDYARDHGFAGRIVHLHERRRAVGAG